MENSSAVTAPATTPADTPNTAPNTAPNTVASTTQVSAQVSAQVAAQVADTDTSAGTSAGTTPANTLGDGLITIDAKRLNDIIKDAVSRVVTDTVSRIVADAVVDIRKGQASVLERVNELNNAVLSLKNAQMTTNQTLAGLKTANGKKSAVVYVNKTDTPADLFNGGD